MRAFREFWTCAARLTQACQYASIKRTWTNMQATLSASFPALEAIRPYRRHVHDRTMMCPNSCEPAVMQVPGVFPHPTERIILCRQSCECAGKCPHLRLFSSTALASTSLPPASMLIIVCASACLLRGGYSLGFRCVLRCVLVYLLGFKGSGCSHKGIKQAVHRCVSHTHAVHWTAAVCCS